MKKLFSLLSLVLLANTSAKMDITKEERELAVKYFNESKEYFLKDVKGLSEAQLNFQPSPEKLSVALCIEHIAIAEKALMEQIQKNLALPVDSAKRALVKAKDTDVWPTVTDRSTKRTTPEFLKPSGKFKNSDEAIQAFLDQRAKNIEYIQTTHDDLRNHFMPHGALGMLDAYQWVLVVAAHCRRHTLQIEEVKADPNFPK